MICPGGRQPLHEDGFRLHEDARALSRGHHQQEDADADDDDDDDDDEDGADDEDDVDDAELSAVRKC